MSGRGFVPVLRALDREMTVPVPRRTRFLRELEHDLEALTGRLVEQGVAPDEARRRVLESLVPDGTVIRHLEEVHAPPYRRLTRHLTPSRLRLLERGAWVLSVAAAIVVSSLTLLSTGVLRDPSPHLWAVLLLAAVLAAQVARTAFGIWVRGPESLDGLAPTAVLALSGLVLAAGIGGVLLDLYALAAEAEADLASATPLAVWLRREATLLAVALLPALAGALSWFVMSQWLAWTRQDRLDLLGPEPLIPSSTEE